MIFAQAPLQELPLTAQMDMQIPSQSSSYAEFIICIDEAIFERHENWEDLKEITVICEVKTLLQSADMLW